MPKRFVIPSGLSAEARKLYVETAEEYSISDPASLVLLLNAARALDRLRLAEAAVKASGATFTDRFGQVKVNPMAVRIDNENLTLARCLRELGLDLSPPPANPRPPEGL